jgi:hypothetical protein
LDETQKALDEIIADMRSNRDYDYGEYIVDLTHIYHHLNTARNARDANKAATDVLPRKLHSLASISHRRYLSRGVITQLI